MEGLTTPCPHLTLAGGLLSRRLASLLSLRVLEALATACSESVTSPLS